MRGSRFRRCRLGDVSYGGYIVVEFEAIGEELGNLGFGLWD